MYLDGRDKPERRVIVYLDPHDEDYNKPDGEVTIKTRWAQGKDGTLKEQAWVFKDVGIETMFDKLIIAGDIDIATPIPNSSEDALVEAMDIAYLSGDADMIREEKSKVGQILVVIERVKLGEKWRDNHFRAKHKEGEPQDVDMQGVGKDITHTTGYAASELFLMCCIDLTTQTLASQDNSSPSSSGCFVCAIPRRRRFICNLSVLLS